MKLLWPFCLLVACAHQPERPVLPLSENDVLAMRNGFEPLRNVQRDGDDFEIRVWNSGFHLTGFILQYIDRELSAFRIVQEYAEIPWHKSARVVPRCFTDDLLDSLEQYRPFNLPPIPECPEPCLDRMTLDGHTLTVETVQKGRATRSNYENPDLDWWDPDVVAPAKGIHFLLGYALGSSGRIYYRSHAQPVAPGTILVRRDDTGYNAAYRITELRYSGETGEGYLSYDAATYKLGLDGRMYLVEPKSSRTVSWRGGRNPRIDEAILISARNGVYSATLIDTTPDVDDEAGLAIFRGADVESLGDRLQHLEYVGVPIHARPCSRERVLTPGQ